ncbi:unnamed protein product [Caenorhabditis sp. 36 PRJEB53466]|nr:unnamed protein product [Caenorhabditis sp. 36 PRJEB53466]
MSSCIILKAAKLVATLIFHSTVLFFASIVFVYFLISGSEKSKERKEKELDSDKQAPKAISYQLVKYTGASHDFNVSFAGKFVQFSVSSGEILKLRQIQNEPNFLRNPQLGPWNRLTSSDKNSSPKKKKCFKMTASTNQRKNY